jgi:hypothetical protein
MQPPNISNLFVPGGVVFFFDPGTGERDIGLIEEPPDVESKATEIKVYSNRSGKRRLAKIFTTGRGQLELQAAGGRQPQYASLLQRRRLGGHQPRHRERSRPKGHFERPSI